MAGKKKNGKELGVKPMKVQNIPGEFNPMAGVKKQVIKAGGAKKKK